MSDIHRPGDSTVDGRLGAPAWSNSLADPAPLLASRIYVLRCTVWLLFLLPVLYAAYLGSVSVHEVLGHGVTALLCGGTFDGFEVRLDGIGHAAAYSGQYPNLVLAGGVLSEIALGSVVMLIALLDRRAVMRRAVLAAFATVCLVSATSYGLWNSYFPQPPGDWGRILVAMPSPVLRLGLVTGFGFISITATLLGSVILFRCLEDDLGPLRGWRLLAALAPFVIGGVVLNFLPDWDRGIGGAGHLPQFGGALLQVAVALLLPAWARPTCRARRIPRRRWLVALGASWVVCAAIAGAVYRWGGAG